MRFSALYFLAFFLILFSSCQKDELLNETVLVSSEEAFIMAEESENYITIRVEALQDTTDNRDGAVNASDYCNISIDINNNGLIDSEIDFGYESGTINYDICSFYFLEDDAITHCGGRDSKAHFISSFIPTAVRSTPHMFWELSIPKFELSDQRTLAFVVKMVDGGEFTSFPPQDKGINPVNFNFDQRLIFEW